jgi:hypothetical protein
MPSLLERLRAALAPRYEVEDEVASGGMAVVFRARDTSLDRVVAVKVLRPDMATATGEARFIREARTLASFSHPNMVSIHDADQRDGLSFYVMDLIQGETLEERLERGPLDGRDTFRLGRDLLDALERIHGAGVVHRDIKPSNVFLLDGRALLADFGIVHLDTGEDDTLTTDGRGPGTPAYMSPEQAKGQSITVRSDLYSLGLVLYEAMTGTRWTSLAAPESGDWSGVSIASRPVVKKALAVDPEDRWQDAAEFRAALRTRGPGIRLPRWAALAVGAGIAALAWWAFAGRGGNGPAGPGSESPDLLDVAVFPCEATQPADSELAENIAWRTALNLDGLPGLTKASTQASFSLYERRMADPALADWTGVLKAKHALRCEVDRAEGGLDVHLRLVDDSGDPVEIETLPLRDGSEEELLRQAAVQMAIHVLGALRPGVTVTEEEVDRFADYRIEALRPFFWGDHFLRRGAWRSAEQSYQAAIAADPRLTLASLRLAEVRRWLVDRPIGANLDSIRRLDLSSLSPLDSLLLDAGARPHGPEQLAAYEAILSRPAYRFDPYATLLYADEVYHRGALWGIPVDSAVSLLRLAVARDSFLVPAVEHLTQALIRTGQAEEAAAALGHLGRIHASPEEAGLDYPAVWGQGFLERFDPDAAAVSRAAMASLPPEEIGLYARWVRYIESPATQVALGEMLVSAADRYGSPALAAQGFVARGLGEITRGRVESGLAAFDSAARRLQTPGTAVQAAEWRVVPYALGVEGFTEETAGRGEGELQALWEGTDTDPGIRARAATALALLADRRGESATRIEWAARLDSLSRAPEDRFERPRHLVSALGPAGHGDLREALDMTAADVAYDSVGLADHPFLRSALYLKRGDWYSRLDMPDSARASWLWHQNTDLEGTVAPELVQAGEVDGAFGPHARRLTDRLANVTSAEGPE